MGAFREYSDKIPFRKRSESPDIAIELSLQPWKAFGVDGVIMFSDILTPLPAMGVEFDVVKGSGPVISSPLRSSAHLKDLTPLQDPDTKLPFLREILGGLAQETKDKTTLMGFVGAPFTLVAYAVEGQANRHCIHTKKMMVQDPALLHAYLSHFSQAIAEYACHQIECGAQIVQFFESWAHHLGPSQFEEFAKPYVSEAMKYVKERHPEVPIVYYANGGSSYLHLQKDLGADVISLDWAADISLARKTLGESMKVQGNIDPTVLFGGDDAIESAVETCISKAGGAGKHILNLGHGVLQGTPETAVEKFVSHCKSIR